MTPTSFKGWTIPGPVPDRTALTLTPSTDPTAAETLDSINGHYQLFQLKKGHRFSTDDLLVAWYGTLLCPRADRVLDLGSGIGSVGTIAAWRLPGAQFVTIEAQSESVRLARKSAQWNGIEHRYTIHEGDFRDLALLEDQTPFDLVLGSPPYFPLGTGIEGDHPQKVACRFEVRGSIDDYCATATRHLAPGGIFVCIFPIEPDHQRVRAEEAGKKAGLTLVRRRAIVLREGSAPLLELFAWMRAEDLPEDLRSQTWKEPDLIIRDTAGKTSLEYRLIKLSIGFPPTG